MCVYLLYYNNTHLFIIFLFFAYKYSVDVAEELPTGALNLCCLPLPAKCESTQKKLRVQAVAYIDYGLKGSGHNFVIDL